MPQHTFPRDVRMKIWRTVSLLCKGPRNILFVSFLFSNAHAPEAIEGGEACHSILPHNLRCKSYFFHRLSLLLWFFSLPIYVEAKLF